ncbi:hypothetical protein SISNIDRAFT_486662 [Sistotremastrum niveocremeum HHB9708]|uniref:Uncharacterized protein n=1 Tax=Sistotremastrum niveocremeum HHB9708 TaxID=1314777 RepID=A0A164T6X5_9AGAM|nr:hypothetical protein SISNIDRAFT_486662 [Sistotremastrum niveocremeum HHB9708]
MGATFKTSGFRNNVTETGSMSFYNEDWAGIPRFVSAEYPSARTQDDMIPLKPDSRRLVFAGLTTAEHFSLHGSSSGSNISTENCAPLMNLIVILFSALFPPSSFISHLQCDTSAPPEVSASTSLAIDLNLQTILPPSSLFFDYRLSRTRNRYHYWENGLDINGATHAVHTTPTFFKMFTAYDRIHEEIKSTTSEHHTYSHMIIHKREDTTNPTNVNIQHPLDERHSHHMHILSLRHRTKENGVPNPTFRE